MSKSIISKHLSATLVISAAFFCSNAFAIIPGSVGDGPFRDIYVFLVGALEGYGAAILTLITTLLGALVSARGGSPMWILGGLFSGVLLSFLPELIGFIVDIDFRMRWF